MKYKKKLEETQLPQNSLFIWEKIVQSFQVLLACELKRVLFPKIM